MNIYEHVSKAVARLSAEGVKCGTTDIRGNEDLVKKIKNLTSWVDCGRSYRLILRPEVVSQQLPIATVDGKISHDWQMTWLGKEGVDVLMSPEEHVYYAIHSDSDCLFFRVEYDQSGYQDMIRVLRSAPEYMLARLAKPREEKPTEVE